MKLLECLLILLFALVGFTSADWKGKVVNKCNFDIWVKTTQQIDPTNQNNFDSPMVKVKAHGGTYNAAFLPIYGEAVAGEAHGVTLKIQTTDDPNFTAGHVYQVEYTPYWYQDPTRKMLSSDLSVVDGNPLHKISRLLELLGPDDKIINPKRCSTKRSTIRCEPNSDPCSSEWQNGHALMAHNFTDLKTGKCPPMNTDPKCSHPVECNAGASGTLRFTLCA